MGAACRVYYRLLAFPISSFVLLASADVLYPGNKYNASFLDGHSCAYPAEATLSRTCPAPAHTYGLAGLDSFDLSDYNDNPPVIFTAVSMVQFGGIDQTQLTFTMTFMIDMIWEDSRGFDQIQRSTLAAAKTGDCARNCGKSTHTGGLGFCCDGMWLPTLKILSAQQKAFVEEDYQIASIIQSAEYPTGGRNYTKYQAVLTATFYQPFDFTAFPFDRHALNVRILCADCQMKRQTELAFPTSADFAVMTIVSQHSSKGTFVDGQSVPASAGWQLNSVDLAIVNATTDYSEKKPEKRSASFAKARVKPDAYGIIFILSVERVTRLFFALQTILPSIILTLIAFTCFLITKRDFADRLKTLISVLFPTFVVQFTITNTLPKTSTLLSPQYLVFISMVEIALLILVAGITSLILNRQTNFAWGQKLAEGKRHWMEERSRSGARQDTVIMRDEENLVDTKDIPATHTPISMSQRMEMLSVQESSGDSGRDHDLAVHKKVASFAGRWPTPCRSVRTWWTLLALSNAEGYREHVAMIWELSALAVCFVIYMAAVLAIFLTLDEKGRDPSTF